MPRTYDPRRAKAGRRYQFADPTGKVHVVEADEDGVITPRNDAEQAWADRRSLPVAQKVKEAEKAERTTAKKES